ncbi:hypothetical protein BJI67_06930 [Acidihalobacter aeolianus]|uniref:Uncharacterized protein n=1 Tax=Acidihalobacter aeolianus TaxID=2792603 RepID=A0A1D8K7B1_9GAMM|nr:oligosaccharide flippase family protein [Acidihalobacter aeolianus]AOV16828.1 hypothetical protein BJI67_06930 [Acidihalobacter aeolianus]
MTNIEQNPEEDVGLHKLKHSGSVLARTAHGTSWLIGWRLANRALGFISTLFLARLLSPSDFGIVALAMGFMQSLNQLSELGTENAIIRDEKHDRAIYDTGFTINLIRGSLVALLIFILAAPAAEFFHSPHFEQVVWLAALISFLNGFENIGIVDFRRFMAFNYEFKLKIIPRIISAVTAILLAFILRNFWALIIAILVNQIITLAMSYVLHPYRPRLTLQAWRRMASYSTMLWFSNLIGLAGGFGTKSIIGKISGIASVGIYEVGIDFASLTTSELAGAFSRALFPGFAELRKAGKDASEMIPRVIGIMALVTFPAGVGISLISYPIVQLALGSKWLNAVPIIEILAITRSLTILGVISTTYFSVHGWMKTIVSINAIGGIIQIILLVFLIPNYGLYGIALSVASAETIIQFCFYSIVSYSLHISISKTLSMVWRSVIGCLIMSIILYMMNLGWTHESSHIASNLSAAYKLGITIAIGSAIYIGVISILWFFSPNKYNSPEVDLLNQVKKIMVRN